MRMFGNNGKGGKMGFEDGGGGMRGEETKGWRGIEKGERGERERIKIWNLKTRISTKKKIFFRISPFFFNFLS